MPGTRPELTPVADHYRIDISSSPPVIDGETYTMPVFGLVDNELSLSLDDLRNNYEPMTQYITLACISNNIGGSLIGTQKWTGASLQKVLADANLQDNAHYLRITGADGFDETVDIDLINQDERIMLTYDWDDQPLPARNGYPLRIYIPDRYGMKQPKWITEIEVVEAYEDGFWVRRNWDRDAIMVTTSVVDVVGVDEVYEENGQQFVPVGGIAHAGARSISKVEVKVDEGAWEEAELRDPLSDKTWVLWRYDWPFQSGQHTFSVRAVDGDGNPQIETRRPTQPSGATGIDSLSVEPLSTISKIIHTRAASRSPFFVVYVHRSCRDCRDTARRVLICYSTRLRRDGQFQDRAQGGGGALRKSPGNWRRPQCCAAGPRR